MSASKKKKSILLIEDEPLLVEIYKQKLKEIGGKIFWAYSAEEAQTILKKEKIDLIILDILLPRKNGLTFLKELKAKKRKLPQVIILSNLGDQKLIKKAVKLKAVKEYLLKTEYTPSQIIEKIKKYL